MVDQIIPLTHLDQAGLSPLYRPASVPEISLGEHGGLERGVSSAHRDAARYERLERFDEARFQNKTNYSRLDTLVKSGLKRAGDYLSQRVPEYQQALQSVYSSLAQTAGKFTSDYMRNTAFMNGERVSPEQRSMSRLKSEGAPGSLGSQYMLNVAPLLAYTQQMPGAHK
jgi:hypothetical protein